MSIKLTFRALALRQSETFVFLLKEFFTYEKNFTVHAVN